MERLLITAFEPFGGRGKNASAEALKALLAEADWPLPLEIHSAFLPVVAGEASRLIREKIEEVQPDVVIMLGEARRDAICLERIGYNEHRFTIPDNNGNLIEGQPIIPGGPDSYQTTLPLDRILEAMQQTGTPVRPSEDAGRYICNEVLYSALHHINERGMETEAGFIHVPHLPEVANEPDYPSLPTEIVVAALRAGLRNLPGGAGA